MDTERFRTLPRFRTGAILAGFFLAIVSPAYGEDGQPRFAVELEGGPVWQGRNDVQIPNNESGTRFALDEFTGSGPTPSFRAYVTWNLSHRSSLRALLAPLTITETGRLDGTTNFAGTTFAANTPTEATYRFNSWRLTYRYLFADGNRWRGWIGFTAKLRDAKVRLEQGTVAAQNTDLGFVPLLHLAGEVRLGHGWRASLDIDALAGGPGRAVDSALKLSRDLGETLRVSAGYRTLEGGADVDSVYNFAWFHYAVLSTEVRF